jgi:GNAT superfamily N-acetyltransferase
MVGVAREPGVAVTPATTSASAAITIRRFGPADSLEELTRLLHAAYARLGAMGLNFTCVDQPVATTQRCVDSGACLLAVCGAEMVGSIVVRRPRPDSCPYYGLPHVASAHQLAVAPAHQGKGIGSMLLGAAEAWARENGFAELALDTAEPATHLVALYGRHGFKHVAYAQWEGKRYRSVVMAKPLPVEDGPHSRR